MSDFVEECEQFDFDLQQIEIDRASCNVFTLRKRLQFSRAFHVEQLWPAFSTHLGSRNESEGIRIAEVVRKTGHDASSDLDWYDSRGNRISDITGKSTIVEPGWTTEHVIEFDDSHTIHEEHIIDRLSEWVGLRWNVVAGMLWSDRILWPISGSWPDVVNRVSELANDDTLARPEYYVITKALISGADFTLGEHLRNWTDMNGERIYWTPLSMWMARNEGKRPHKKLVRSEDEKRIGDNPDEMWNCRQKLLCDSIKVLRWMAEQFGRSELDVGTTAADQVAVPLDGLSSDGLSLRWGGKLYPIKPRAARVLRLLVDSFESGFPYLSEEYLKTEGESESDMRHLVRDGGLADVVIREVGPEGKIIKGKWGLIDPKKLFTVQQIHT